MRLAKLARGNPLVVIGAAAVGGWLLGSGIFAIPGLGSIPAPHPVTPTAPAAPAQLPTSGGQTAGLQTSSATMGGPPAAVDPFAGWNL